MATQEVPPGIALYQLGIGHYVSRALALVATLGVADHMNGPTELASTSQRSAPTWSTAWSASFSMAATRPVSTTATQRTSEVATMAIATRRLRHCRSRNAARIT